MDQEGKFEFIKELGRGSFGAVVLAKNTKTGEQVAIKKMERAHLQRYVESEILNHSQLRHPHVVQFREVFLSPHHINIVMDFASGGSLFGYVQSRNRLREPLARCVAVAGRRTASTSGTIFLIRGTQPAGGSSSS